LHTLGDEADVVIEVKMAIEAERLKPRGTEHEARHVGKVSVVNAIGHGQGKRSAVRHSEAR
jgi:hypothetical protein